MFHKYFLFLLFVLFLLNARMVNSEVRDCSCGDFTKGHWEYVYPDTPSKVVCTFPGTITSYTSPFIEGGCYRGYLILRVHKCGESFECKNNNLIYEPPGPYQAPCSLERYCTEGYQGQGTKFKNGYCYYPDSRQSDGYDCFVGGGQVVGDLQRWTCNQPPPEEPVKMHGFGPPLCQI